MAVRLPDSHLARGCRDWRSKRSARRYQADLPRRGPRSRGAGAAGSQPWRAWCRSGKTGTGLAAWASHADMVNQALARAQFHADNERIVG